MNVLVIDGQGGGLGRQLVAALSAQCPDIRLVPTATSHAQGRGAARRHR